MHPAIGAATERRLVRRLRQSRALSSSSAQPLPDLRHIDKRVLERLQRVGAVREASGQKWFLDESAYEIYVQSRRRILAIVLVIVMVIVVVCFVAIKS